MPNPSRQARMIRFGIYEADLAGRELRKDGAKVKLQDRPFEVLTILLERPGEVIAREEFRQRLWPADTFVDFDPSLNTSINKLRQALSDDAENPRFIATVGRRGYRFIAPTDAGKSTGLVGGVGRWFDTGDKRGDRIEEPRWPVAASSGGDRNSCSDPGGGICRCPAISSRASAEGAERRASVTQRAPRSVGPTDNGRRAALLPRARRRSLESDASPRSRR